jgi:hypothetical protein
VDCELDGNKDEIYDNGEYDDDEVGVDGVDEGVDGVDEGVDDVEGVNVCVGPLLGVAKTILPLEIVAEKPNGLVNKLLLLGDCVNIIPDDPDV